MICFAFFSGCDLVSERSEKDKPILEVVSDYFVSSDDLTFVFEESQSSKKFIIKNIGGGLLDWAVVLNKSWMKIIGDFEGSDNYRKIYFEVDRQNLADGEYSGEIVITSLKANQSVKIKVVLKVLHQADLPLPADLTFIDEDQDQGQISGYITWNKAVDESAITHYEVYYFDNNNEKRDYIGRVKKGKEYKLFISADTTLETGKNKIGIFSVDDYTYSQDCKIINILDLDFNNFSLPRNLQFEDEDEVENRIGGVLSWLPAFNELNIDGYNVKIFACNKQTKEVTESIFEKNIGVEKGLDYYLIQIPSGTKIYRENHIGSEQSETTYKNFISVTPFSASQDFSNASVFGPLKAELEIVDLKPNFSLASLGANSGFVDTDPDEGEIYGNLRWNWPYKEDILGNYYDISDISSFYIYFLDDQDRKIEESEMKASTGSGISLINKNISDLNISKIGIFTENLEGELSSSFTAVSITI